MELDCAIVGGGPAGLSAALVLGRAGRRVAVLDEGKPRNAVVRQTHGFLTRDGASPREMRQLAWNELARYDSVILSGEKVSRIRRLGRGFELVSGDGSTRYARKLLLATGLSETLPSIPGIKSFYGSSLFSCPYCDGWELRGQPLVVIAEGRGGFGLARLVLQWSRNVTLCTNGMSNAVTSDEANLLRRHGVEVIQEPIVELIGEEERLSALRFANGRRLHCTGGFVSPYWRQSSPFGVALGCAMNERGGLESDGQGRCSVFGIYAAGDLTVMSPAQAIIAAGEGSKAAIAINSDLINEDIL
ncbi:NAD(P)/FAD-dependent oxidoreductase [Paenibacillus sp. CAU 1782]